MTTDSGNRPGADSGVPALVLAIDHRNSLRHWYVAVTGAEVPDSAALSAGKVIAAEGLLAAISDNPAYDTGSGQPMLLIDEEYGGGAIARIREANAAVPIIVPAERSGQPEFSFEYGDEFGAQLAKTRPDIVKALVRYNPAGDAGANARSRAKLADLERWLDAHGLPFMLELLVPPATGQAPADFDTSLRPELTLRAIAELRDAGLSPAYWKVEGQASTDAFSMLARAANGRCLVLGRGADFAAVGRWVAMAAAAEGFSGFAVGRTIWADPLADWLTGRARRADAVAAIAANYLHCVTTYLKNRSA